MSEPLEWQCAMSLSAEHEHKLHYKSSYKGKSVQATIKTPVLDDGEFGEQEYYFYISGDPREFRTEEELKGAIDGEKTTQPNS